MPEYLSKEEVKQWRSSLEKITLEEYAARLGKVLEEEKHTNDLVDIVMNSKPVVSRIEETNISGKEKISSIMQKSFSKEKELANKTNFSAKKSIPNKDILVESVEKSTNSTSLKEVVKITFSKALTEREQIVFNYFLQNKGNIVYAKDLAGLLGLPRDYVYKYIKNLRAKIDGDKLQNDKNGGYVLNA